MGRPRKNTQPLQRLSTTPQLPSKPPARRNHKRKEQGPPRHQKGFGAEKRGEFHAEVISNALIVKTPIRGANGAIIYPLASSAKRDGEGRRYPKRKRLPPVAMHKYMYDRTPGGAVRGLVQLPTAGMLPTPRLKNEPRMQHLPTPKLVKRKRTKRSSVKQQLSEAVQPVVAAPVGAVVDPQFYFGSEFLRKIANEVGPKIIEVGNPRQRKMHGTRPLLYYKSSDGDGQATIRLTEPGDTAWGKARRMRLNELFIIAQSQIYEITAETADVTVQKMFLRKT